MCRVQNTLHQLHRLPTHYMYYIRIPRTLHAHYIHITYTLHTHCIHTTYALYTHYIHITYVHCIALHCTALHCTALHFVASHCSALHYSRYVTYIMRMKCNTMQRNVMQCTYVCVCVHVRPSVPQGWHPVLWSLGLACGIWGFLCSPQLGLGLGIA